MLGKDIVKLVRRPNRLEFSDTSMIVEQNDEMNVEFSTLKLIFKN